MRRLVVVLVLILLFFSSLEFLPRVDGGKSGHYFRSLQKRLSGAVAKFRSKAARKKAASTTSEDETPDLEQLRPRHRALLSGASWFGRRHQRQSGSGSKVHLRDYLEDEANQSPLLTKPPKYKASPRRFLRNLVASARNKKNVPGAARPSKPGLHARKADMASPVTVPVATNTALLSMQDDSRPDSTTEQSTTIFSAPPSPATPQVVVFGPQEEERVAFGIVEPVYALAPPALPPSTKLCP